ALMVATGPAMGRNEGPLMIDLHGGVGAPLHLNGLADVGRWDRVAVGLHRDQAIPGDRAQQTGLELIGGPLAMGAQALFTEHVRRSAKRGAVNALVGDGDYPFLHGWVQGVPAGKRAPQDETPLDVLDARLHLAFRLRPIGPTQPRRKPIVACEIP